MYKRKLPFIANGYTPFGSEAYERGRHYAHIWKPTGQDRWRFRIYRYGRPKSNLIKAAKNVLAEMQAPLKMLGQVGISETDWALWVQKVLNNKYNYTWTEFYFSEHQIPDNSPWATEGKIKGPLWADVDPMTLIDMQIYDKAEQQYQNAQEYERRVVAEEWMTDFFNAPGQMHEVRKELHEAIKNAPLSRQILCPSCYRYNSIDDSTNSIIECRECGEKIDTVRAKKAKQTLTYDSIKNYINKKASLMYRLTLAEIDNEYWIAILGDSTKLYDSEDLLIKDIEKEIDSLSVQIIAEEAKVLLLKEMPILNDLKDITYTKFEQMTQQQEEEYALVANLDNINRIIESIDSRGFSKEAKYLRILSKKRI